MVINNDATFTWWKTKYVIIPFLLLLGQANHTGGIMVSVLASSVVDRGFQPRTGQTKDYKIGICCFSAKHAALRRKSKDWLVRNQNNVTEWSDMSIRRLLFQWASTIKIILSIWYPQNAWVFGWQHVFQQTAGIPLGTNCISLLPCLFLCSHEADFMRGPFKKKEARLVLSFHFLLNRWCPFDE